MGLLLYCSLSVGSKIGERMPMNIGEFESLMWRNSISRNYKRWTVKKSIRLKSQTGSKLWKIYVMM
jgi:hypothetical protein